MDDFARLPPEERRAYFEAAAAKAGNLGEHIIEKDFWVCWTLKHLFSLPLLKGHLIFKGGTSLSKVFSVIERFSEDIDLSVSKELLGFTGEKNPENEKGSKKREKLIAELSDVCKYFVKTKLFPELEKTIKDALGTSIGWKLEIDTDDPDEQTILFQYPSTDASKPGYVRPIVKIELGARSDQWPAHNHDVHPYLHVHISDALKSPNANVHALDASRTFWEKATILHSYAHYPEGKKFAERQSRHYYDMYRLLQTKHKDEALSDLELLERVAFHKTIYFRVGWAKYDQAKKGSLKLLPAGHITDSMRGDYEQMQEMFFGEAPAWEEILAEIAKFEKEFNSNG